jgi:ubiquinone/menaquinone biosynthesis C-methylase UbiE
MGVEGADWLERPEREREERPELAVKLLDIRPGMIIADIGAGSGYFTRRLARRTGPAGKVYAVDIQPAMIELLGRNAAREGLTNIIPVLGAEADPRLPPASIDLMLLVDVYHEFARPQAMLRQMRQALKPGGRLVLLEYRKEDPDVPIRYEHKMSVKEVRAELEAEGFRFEKLRGELPRQHLLIFRNVP